MGFLRGLITCWNLSITLLSCFNIYSSLCIDILCKGLGIVMIVLNLYGPYEGKQDFWDILLATNCFKVQNLIMGGDLNLILNRGDNWGQNARFNRITYYFCHHFDQEGLVDVGPIELRPIWKNNRIGSEGISKDQNNSWSKKIYQKSSKYEVLYENTNMLIPLSYSY